MAATIGKINPSFISATQETTIALASFNFDFSLVKVAPPEEFTGLGNSLSSVRRESAENGQVHITARKLGALFEGIVPETPALVKAYGERVSEIAAFEQYNPKGVAQKDGFFSAQVGADGTSIWAAATSGESAIAVHLLACLLARLWTGSQATAIWSELVSERQNILKQARTDTDLKMAMASCIVVSREELAGWDASARAWLQTADAAKKLQQTQLNLIIDNIRLAVDARGQVYESVLRTWVDTMITVDRLVRGTGQSVQSGAILLGLTSWHLYPDLVVLGSPAKEIRQNDPLVATGGLVTIGLQTPGDVQSSGGDGIYWSLPLGNLRYYGEPVRSNRYLVSDASKISFNQLGIIALGRLARMWNLRQKDCRLLSAFIVDLYILFDPDTLWPILLGGLIRSASSLLEASGLDLQEAERLFAYSYRRCDNFLTPRECEEFPPPIFGLDNFSRFISFLSSEEDKISALRRFAAKHNIKSDDLVIRYMHTENSKGAEVYYWEYCSVYPVTQSGTKRDSDGNPIPGSSRYRRWVSTELIKQWKGNYEQFPYNELLNWTALHDNGDTNMDEQDAQDEQDEQDEKEESGNEDEELAGLVEWGLGNRTKISEFDRKREETCRNYLAWRSQMCGGEEVEDKLYTLYEPAAYVTSKRGKNRKQPESPQNVYEDFDTFYYDEPDQILHPYQNNDHHYYSFVCGDPKSAAIYTRGGDVVKAVFPDTVNMTEVGDALASSELIKKSVQTHFIGLFSTPSLFRTAMLALSLGASVYEMLPGALIPLSVVKKPLSDAVWIAGTWS